MSGIEPDMNRRGPELPPGCKDLTDLLKSAQAPKTSPKLVGLDPISTEHVFINGKIRARKVQVCDEAGAVLGVVPIGEALALAESRDVDLVLVNAKVTPPLCVLIDYGKYCYQQNKKKRKQGGPQ